MTPVVGTARLLEGRRAPALCSGVGLHRARPQPPRPALWGWCSGSQGLVVAGLIEHTSGFVHLDCSHAVAESYRASEELPYVLMQAPQHSLPTPALGTGPRLLPAAA